MISRECPECGANAAVGDTHAPGCLESITKQLGAQLSDADPAVLGAIAEAQPKAATKLDGGKVPVVAGCFAYFPHALEAVAEVSVMGSEKYEGNMEPMWRQVVDGLRRYTDAIGRHLLAPFKAGAYATPKKVIGLSSTNVEILETDYDEESNLLHDAHRAWDALATLELKLRDGVPLIHPERGRYVNPKKRGLAARSS